MRAAVAIVAGGEATRLPGKLELDAGGGALLVRVLRNVGLERETAIAVKGSFAPAIDAQLDVPLVVDRWVRRGPLAGLLSALPHLRARHVFALAGDAPFVDAGFLERLEDAWVEGDEALVPVSSAGGRERFEPLCALYERNAVLREGPRVLRSEGASLQALIRRLRARPYRLAGERVFDNVNTPAQYAALRAHLTREPG